ncbi:hypothetical protein ACI79P_19880 [Blastococcus sp. SYSU DS0510]
MTETLTLTPPRSDVPVRRTGPSLPALIGLEMHKSTSHRSGTAFAGAAGLFGPVGIAVAALEAEIGWAAGPIGVAGMLTGMVLLSLGVVSTASEWTNGSVQTTYLLVPSRGRVLAAKAAAVALLGAAFAAASAALSVAVIAVVGTEGIDWDGTGRALLAVVGAGAAFAVTGAGVGAALANTPAALTVLYLLILGVLPLVRIGKPELGEKLDPAQATLELAQGGLVAQSVLVLAGWVIVSAVAGWVLTSRRAVQ